MEPMLSSSRWIVGGITIDLCAMDCICTLNLLILRHCHRFYLLGFRSPKISISILATNIRTLESLAYWRCKLVRDYVYTPILAHYDSRLPCTSFYVGPWYELSLQYLLLGIWHGAELFFIKHGQPPQYDIG